MVTLRRSLQFSVKLKFSMALRALTSIMKFRHWVYWFMTESALVMLKLLNLSLKWSTQSLKSQKSLLLNLRSPRLLRLILHQL